ncbi:hypothetical protein [Microbacterium sp. W4I20]|uniref:hypothetical protein n=1 Tax=Microbacterium sp. W4I20 TaxID=3042262 RepID=UPI002783E7CF|nr:hypothetical protein [Microbacterium sp. W4I20]MDQ0728207.1 hypothetical protein [Microbacterium sp. W4I20]
MESTPHPQDPAEGAPGVGVPHEDEGHDGGDEGPIQGDADRGESTGGAIQGSAGEDDGIHDGGDGGAIQGDASRGESTGGAIQGSAGPDHEAPLGGDDTTADQLQADNPAEEETLKTLDPDSPPA